MGNIDTEKLWRNFVDTITNHYTDFTGRIGRAQFWYFVLVYVAVGFAVSIVGQIVASGGALSSLYNLALFLPSLGMTMRRLQDTGRPGSWAWLLAVPVGAGILLTLFALVTFLTLGLGAVLLLLAPLFFAAKMVHWDLSPLLPASYPWNHYWLIVLQLPAKLLLLFGLLFVCRKTGLLEEGGLRSVGLTTRGFDARPYFLLLLLLVPVVASLGLAIGGAGRKWGVDAWLAQRWPSSLLW